MEWSKLLLGGAAFGAVAGLWNQIRALLWKVCNLLLREIELREPVTAAAVAGYLVSHYRRVGLYTPSYSTTSDYHMRDGERRVGIIAFERFGTQSIVFYRGPWPLLFQGSSGNTVAGSESQASGGAKSTGGGGARSAKLVFLRGTVDIDRLLADAAREWNQIGWEFTRRGGDTRRRFFIKYLPDASKDKGPGAAAMSSSWQHYSNIRLVDLSPEDVGLGAHDQGMMLDRLFFPDEVRTLIEEVKTWRKSHDWYRSRGIPWKRGWLLYGKPGTGKTALAGAFAHDLDLPIFVFNLGEMGNIEFMAEWKAMLASTPCIALIEDMDTVFHGRDNISRREFSLDRQWDRISRTGGAARAGARPDGGEGDEFDRTVGGRPGFLSFDVLLNCIDGVDRAEGVFTIITTNYVERIDPALGQPTRRADGTIEFISTRPGRIDRAVELSEMKPYVKKRMAAHILGEFPEECEAMLRHIDAHPEELETPAQFQQRCNQIALNRFWQREKLREEREGADRGELRPNAEPSRLRSLP